MNDNPEIFSIITGYFTGEISDRQREILNEWLKNPANKELFKSYAKANYLAAATPYQEEEKKTSDNGSQIDVPSFPPY